MLNAECSSQRDGNKTVRQNARAQSTAAFQPLLGPLVTKRLVHPVTRLAFLHTGEAHVLNFKFHPDQCPEINAADKNISPRRFRPRVRKIQLAPHRFEHFEREKGNLTLVVLLEIEIAIAANAAARDALEPVSRQN